MPANAIVAVDNGDDGAVYTGAALATRQGGTFLYVANFAAGSIDVFDASFGAGRLLHRHERTC
jgi:hypothetical protein